MNTTWTRASFGLIAAIATTIVWTSAGSAARTGSDDRQTARSAGESVRGSHDYYEITASHGYLVGGEGKSGDVMQYRGRKIWSGPSQATILVNERTNQGLVIGSVQTHDHTYTVIMNEFWGNQDFKSGGIAKNVYLHGTTGQGPPILPKAWTYLAGWGGCTVFKDADILYDNFDCHFMLTETVRDPHSHAVPDFPSKDEIRKLLRSKRRPGDLEGIDAIKRNIREAADWQNAGLQLHVIAHAPEPHLGHLPPYDAALHFMWDDVTWWRGPATQRTADRDRDIERRIERELRENSLIDERDIDVRVRDGRVTLSGTVDRPLEKNHAYFAAWVPGVKSITNRLDAERDEPVSDERIRQTIQHAYTLDPRVVHTHPRVRVDNGRVTLSGTVMSREARRAAADIARQFEGVEQVENRLEVGAFEELTQPEGGADRRVWRQMGFGMTEEDRELKEDIESELAWSPFVDADEIRVSVRDGVATLTGTVSDEDERSAAIENAYEAGADEVKSRLRILPETSDFFPTYGFPYY